MYMYNYDMKCICIKDYESFSLGDITNYKLNSGSFELIIYIYLNEFHFHPVFIEVFNQHFMNYDVYIMSNRNKKIDVILC